MHSEYDLAIIGSGLVGSSLTLALQGSGLRIVQIEAQGMKTEAAGFDERHLALNAHTVQQLVRLGAESVAREGAAIEQLHISRRGEFGRVRLRARDYDLEAFGRVVPARVLGAALEGAVAKVPELARLRPARLQAFRCENEGISLDVEHAGSSLSLRCRMLVGADGSTSTVAKLAGIAAEVRDYAHQALVFNLRAERPAAGCAYERFTERGPIALLPLPERRMGAVWTLPLADAEAAMALPEAGFLGEFQSSFGYRLGRFSKLGRRSRWPLSCMRAHASNNPRIVLIGNAAQTVHPLGAQGFNLGLRDALALARTLREGDLDSATLVEAYQAARAPDREQTFAFSDSMLVASSSDNTLAKLGRALGFAVLDRFGPAKLELVRWGLGHLRSAA